MPRKRMPRKRMPRKSLPSRESCTADVPPQPQTATKRVRKPPMRYSDPLPPPATPAPSNSTPALPPKMPRRSEPPQKSCTADVPAVPFDEPQTPTRRARKPPTRYGDLAPPPAIPVPSDSTKAVPLKMPQKSCIADVPPNPSDLPQTPTKRNRKTPERPSERRKAANRSIFAGVSRDSLQRYMAHNNIPRRKDLKKNLVRRVQEHFDAVDISNIDMEELHKGVARQLRKTEGGHKLTSPGNMKTVPEKDCVDEEYPVDKEYEKRARIAAGMLLECALHVESPSVNNREVAEREEGPGAQRDRTVSDLATVAWKEDISISCHEEMEVTTDGEIAGDRSEVENETFVKEKPSEMDKSD